MVLYLSDSYRNLIRHPLTPIQNVLQSLKLYEIEE